MSARRIPIVMVVLLGTSAGEAQPSSGPQSAEQREIEQLRARTHELELKTALVEQHVRHAFDSLKLVGTTLSVVLAGLTIWSFIRESRYRKDYMQERKFYEERALKLETRQEVAASNDAARANQQLQLGNTLVDRSGDMLTGQIENISKLGGVISLVEQTFKLQLSREQAQSEQMEDFEKTRAWVEQFENEFKKRHEDAVRGTLDSFGSMSAMSWPGLSEELQNLARRMRFAFEAIPDFVSSAARECNAGEYARVKQLLGTAAFYSNDIDAALHDLNEANALFDSKVPLSEHPYARAYTKHFLGIAEKNWRREPGNSNLINAQVHLQSALDIFKNDDKRFLTAVTHAEVMSYRQASRMDAAKALDIIIDDLRQRIEADKADANQRALIIRAHLLRGNIFAMEDDVVRAKAQYELALSRDADNAYALLSLAEARKAGEAEWSDALKALEKSGALDKRELTTHVSVLAWAVIAASGAKKTDDEQRYRAELYRARGTSRVRDRSPVFFAPRSKGQVDFDALIRELTPNGVPDDRRRLTA